MRNWYVILGVVLAVLLPVLVALNVSLFVNKLPPMMAYPVAFGFVTLAGQAGLLVARLDKGHQAAPVARDVFIAITAGFGAYWATRLMILRGGAGTDPALLALACTYLLMVWRAPSRRR